MQKISKSIKDTGEIAGEFVKKLTSPHSPSPGRRGENATLIGLYGNLGAGKTAFVQAVAKHLGIKRKVASPTFVIMKRYVLKNKKFKNLFHLDAYRLKNKKELLHLGWAEIIKNGDNIIFIEWPEQVRGAMPKGHHKVKIAHTNEGHRKFTIN